MVRIILLKVHQDPPHHHPHPNKRLWMQCTGGGDIANPNFLSHQYNLRTSFVNFYVCHPYHHHPNHCHPHPHPHHHHRSSPTPQSIRFLGIATSLPLVKPVQRWSHRWTRSWWSWSSKHHIYCIGRGTIKTWGTPQWPNYLSKSYITMITKWALIMITILTMMKITTFSTNNTIITGGTNVWGGWKTLEHLVTTKGENCYKIDKQSIK